MFHYNLKEKFVTSNRFDIVITEHYDEGYEVRLLHGRTDDAIARFDDVDDARDRAETLADGLFGDDYEVNDHWEVDG